MFVLNSWHTLKFNECRIGQLQLNLSKYCPALPEAFAGAHAESSYPGIVFSDTERLPAGGGLEVEACSSRVLERASQGTACISPRGRRGSQGHRAGKVLKMTPSAARVAGIASAACTRVSTRPSIFWGQSGTMGRVQEYIYISVLTIALFGYIHGAAVAEIGCSSIFAFATRPGRHLIGRVNRF